MNTTVRGKTATKILHLEHLFRARETGVLLALFVMCLFLSFASDAFLTSTNLLNIGRQVSLIGIMAVGMTFVLTCGEVDLSVGSNYAFSGLTTGMLIISGWSLVPAIAAGLLCGVAIGLVNGVLSTYGRLPSLIATLHAQRRARCGAHHDRGPAGHRQLAQWRRSRDVRRLQLYGPR